MERFRDVADVISVAKLGVIIVARNYA